MLSGDLLIVEYIILLHSIFVSILIETTIIEFTQPIPAHQEFTSRMVGVQYFVKLK